MSDIKSEAFMKYLGCPCTYFPAAKDDAPIMEAYRKACSRGEKEGFVPVLVAVDDTLWECLKFNTDDENEGAEWEFNSEKAAKYRENILLEDLEDGSRIVSQYISARKEEAEMDEFDWDEDIMGDIQDEEDEYTDGDDRLTAIWGWQNDTVPLVLAEIPVKNPWEIFAYLPFGGWNECPDTKELMAVTKYWYEKYGAVPAVITHDVLQMRLEEPVGEDDADTLALEQYGFCPDIVDQGCGAVNLLAKELSKSKTWYFWWD